MTADEEAVSFATFWQVYRVPMVLGGTSLLFVLLSITIFIKSYQSVQPVEFRSHDERASDSGIVRSDRADLYVDVEGAVIRPGVYRLPAGSRVEDALALAGGLSARADADALARMLNRAAKLTDGSKIYVPKTGDVSGVGTGGVSGKATISINRASQAELEDLPGVGAATAEKIIGGRPYLRLEELVEKKIVGASLFSRLKDRVSL